ncbi:hypothetical protein Tco_0998592 [Tanacetum coccineum]
MNETNHTVLVVDVYNDKIKHLLEPDSLPSNGRIQFHQFNIKIDSKLEGLIKCSNQKTVPVLEGSSKTTTEGYMENYKIVSHDIQDQLNASTEAVQIILTRIDNDIYSIVDACPNACEMWKALERLKQSESFNVQDLETNLYWEFGKFTSRDGESPELYYSRKRGNEIVNSSTPTYDQEPEMVTEDDTLSKKKEIDKLMALISLSFNKIYKPTNKNLRTSSNTSRANLGNTPRINRGTRYDSQRVVNVAGARENVGKQVVQQFGIQYYNCKEYRHVARECQKPKRGKDAAYHKEKMLLFTLDVADNSGPIFDAEPLQKVEQDEHNMIIDSLDISYDSEQVDHDDDDLAKERNLLASLIEKLKYEIDDSKNRNKFLETSNKALVDKLKGEIKDFKTKNKSLESSNSHFKEANNELSKTNQLMFKDIKKLQAELDRYHDVNYASKVAIDCAKAKGDLMSYKMESEKSFNEYTPKINNLNQTILEMKKELFAHHETISIMSQEKEAQIMFYKTREDKEIEKVIALENKGNALDCYCITKLVIVQTMNMLNHNCKTSFVKPEFLKKAQRANPRLYDIGCYNDNLALMLAPESDETIHLAQESRSKLSDLIRPFDYKNLNNLYDLFVPQREKSPEQRYFSERSKMSHILAKNENSKESFNKHTTLLERRMDESIPWDQKCKSSKELFKIKSSVDTIFDGVERCKQTIAKRTYFEEMVADLRYFNSLENEVDSLKSQLETQKTQFLNEIDRLSREYYYADHMNAILGVYTTLDEFIDLQCDYVDQVVKYALAKKDFSKSKTVTINNVSSDLSNLVTTQILPQNVNTVQKNTNVIAPEMYKVQPNQTRTTQLPQDIRKTNKCVSFSTGVIPTTSVSRPQLKSNKFEDRVMHNNSQ